ncbi:MAG: phosphomannomutase/phosphoglucomutase [Arenimonas sp.]
MRSKQSPVERLREWVQRNPWLTAMAVLAAFALWFAYRGVDVFGQNKAERDILAARDAAVTAVAARSGDLVGRMLAVRKQVEPLLAAGDEGPVKLHFREAFKQAEAVELFTPELSAAYADIGAFGAGKLGLLEAALNDDSVAMRVIKAGGGPKLALVKSIGGGAQTRLVYVQLPLSELDAALGRPVQGARFLALRQGQFDVLSRGDAALASTAELNASKVGKTPWRVVASAPLADKGLFGAGGIGEFVLAALFAAAAAACRFAPALLQRRRHAAAFGHDEVVEGDATLTLEEMRQKGLLAQKLAAERPVFNIKEAVRPKVPLERSIFRAYDIRGVVGTNLDAGIARLIGEAVGTVLVEKGLAGIHVGYDGRLSSPDLAEGLREGLASTGVAVVDLGCVPTPLVYFAAANSEFRSGISLTGSHNPPDYNGFKIVVDGHTLSGDAITALFDRIVDKKIIKAETPGAVTRRDVLPEYIRTIADDIHIERPLKVVVDCGNGVPGAVAPQVLTAIGAQVEEIHCEVDGNFPNHHPDPSDPDNLQDLIELVKRSGADLGLAFDGDGDRLGVVTAQGEIVYPDRLLMLFAEDVLSRNPGAAIIYDVKCTGALQGHILRNGGSPLMWKTGHSLIKAKMKETHAELAGEMSGHFFFAERWFGFDDGIYSAARLLEILAAAPEGIQAAFDALPTSVSTPELKIAVEEGRQHALIERFVAEAHFEGARISLIDGLRADWPDGWGLVRASNTTPVLVLRFEANDQAGLTRIQEAFRERLLALDPALTLPF